MNLFDLRSQEDRATDAGHSIVLGGNLTGHVLHARDCEMCEIEAEEKPAMDKYEPITVSPEYQEALDRESEIHGFAWNGTLHVDREGKCPLDRPAWLRRLQPKDLTGQVLS